MAGERGTILGSRTGVADHRWEVQQHREACAALDQRPDRGAPQAENEIALPVPGNRPVLSFGGALANQDLVGHKVLAAPSGAGSRDAQRPPGPQASGELAPQSAAALHICDW